MYGFSPELSKEEESIDDEEEDEKVETVWCLFTLTEPYKYKMSNKFLGE